jgi:hypothetical protein
MRPSIFIGPVAGVLALLVTGGGAGPASAPPGLGSQLPDTDARIQQGKPELHCTQEDRVTVADVEHLRSVYGTADMREMRAGPRNIEFLRTPNYTLWACNCYRHYDWYINNDTMQEFLDDLEWHCGPDAAGWRWRDSRDHPLLDKGRGLNLASTHYAQSQIVLHMCPTNCFSISLSSESFGVASSLGQGADY